MLDYRIKITYTCTKMFTGSNEPTKETRTAYMASKRAFIDYMKQVESVRKELSFEINVSDNKEVWTYYFKNSLLEITSVFSMRRLTEEEYNQVNKYIIKK